GRGGRRAGGGGQGAGGSGLEGLGVGAAVGRPVDAAEVLGQAAHGTGRLRRRRCRVGAVRGGGRSGAVRAGRAGREGAERGAENQLGRAGGDARHMAQCHVAELGGQGPRGGQLGGGRVLDDRAGVGLGRGVAWRSDDGEAAGGEAGRGGGGQLRHGR